MLRVDISSTIEECALLLKPTNGAFCSVGGVMDSLKYAYHLVARSELVRVRHHTRLTGFVEGSLELELRSEI